MTRQAAAWIDNDFSAAAADWDPRGRLTAPRGVDVAAADIAGVAGEWHQMFVDLDVLVVSISAVDNGSWLAVEWVWSVTRRSDGKRSSTADAIIVELADSLITSWREYFDTWGSVEFSS